MSDLDLTGAVEAVRRILSRQMVDPVSPATLSERCVTAAAPLIEAQVRERIAAEIEAGRDQFRRVTATVEAGDLVSRVYDDAARIARRGGAS